VKPSAAKMKPRREAALAAKAIEIVAQEARHLADCADYDEIAGSDEEDDFLRAELRRLADVIDTKVFRDVLAARKRP